MKKRQEENKLKTKIYINEKKWNKLNIKPERNEDTGEIWRNGESLKKIDNWAKIEKSREIKPRVMFQKL